ncbi:hypothetical protein AWB82_01473 [Caballeronia glebae]|uniref:Uncharacterized protein n=1 Tax=Caballeronia glebae TaxID=1777143 RepID=A0A157ZZ40_9BURK|nr:hypothetical protein AWB82_01473 [Caballeronia glebae]
MPDFTRSGIFSWLTEIVHIDTLMIPVPSVQGVTGTSREDVPQSPNFFMYCNTIGTKISSANRQ